MLSIEGLTSICLKHSGIRGFYVSELIPDKNLENARKYFKIPNTVKVIGLYDNTVFGNNKTGFAICKDGFYWDNGFARYAGGGHVVWEEFKTLDIAVNKKYYVFVQIGEIYNIGITRPENNRRVLQLLVEIQDYLKNPETFDSKQRSDHKRFALDDSWMIAVRDNEYGPYDAQTVKQIVKSGQVNADECLVWKEEHKEWIPLSQIDIFKELFQNSASTNEPSSLPFEPNKDNQLIDINGASLDELLNLPGFNIEKANLFIKERKIRIAFNSIEEIGEFLGLKPHLIEELRVRTILNKSAIEKTGRIVDF